MSEKVMISRRKGFGLHKILRGGISQKPHTSRRFSRRRVAYDARGRRTSVTDPLGNAVATAYDPEGRVLSVRGAACPVDWGYDEWGDRVSMATYRDGSLAAGDVTRWLRDAATGLVTNRVSADGRRTAYAYDALGRPVRRTDARGISTDYAYDAAGDLAQVSHSDGTPSAAFARDRAGRLVAAVTDGVSTNLLAYDEFGAVTNETQNGVAVERLEDVLAGRVDNPLGVGGLDECRETGEILALELIRQHGLPRFFDLHVHVAESIA